MPRLISSNLIALLVLAKRAIFWKLILVLLVSRLFLVAKFVHQLASLVSFVMIRKTSVWIRQRACVSVLMATFLTPKPVLNANKKYLDVLNVLKMELHALHVRKPIFLTGPNANYARTNYFLATNATKTVQNACNANPNTLFWTIKLNYANAKTTFS